MAPWRAGPEHKTPQTETEGLLEHNLPECSIILMSPHIHLQQNMLISIFQQDETLCLELNSLKFLYSSPLLPPLFYLSHSLAKMLKLVQKQWQII